MKTRHGADCGSDQQLLIATFSLKLKKVGKTTRPFRYELNLIPYDYTVEVTEIQEIRSARQTAWRTMDRGSYHCTGISDQNHLKAKEMQEGKVVVWGGLTHSWGKKRSKKQGRKGKIYSTECRFPENSKERWEYFLHWIVQRNRGKQQNGND